jgi:outer membrane autotransporter protein
MNGNFSFGDRPTTSRVSGYDFRMFGTTLGLDYRVLDGLYTGMAFGYEGNGSEFADYKGDTDSDTYSLNLYASLNQFENYYLDLLFRYGWTDYNTRRNFTDSGGNSDSATANYDGIDYSFVVNTGYRFVFDEFSVQPYGRFEYVAVDTDSYREDGAAGSADSWLLDVSAQRMQSLRTNFGAQASYAVSTGFGVLVPSVTVEWVHEYKNKSRTVTSTLFNQTGTSTVSSTDNPDRDFINVGGSLNGVFAQGFSGFVSYRAQAGNSLLFQQQVNAGLRLEL